MTSLGSSWKRSDFSMKFVFRTDASLSIGNGHVMRCLSLAQALRAHGGACVFVCTSDVGNLNALVSSHGFAVCSLPVFPNETRTCSEQLLSLWREDALATIQALQTLKPVDWLILDHYGLDQQWEQELRPHVGQLMVIDDLANRAHACDILLDQNPGRLAEDYAHWVPSNCKVLTGPSFAMLREDITDHHPKTGFNAASNDIANILISLGGVDSDNITGQVLQALQSFKPAKPLAIQVVMGPNAPWIDSVKSQSAAMYFPTRVLQNPGNFADLMCEQTLAIGAAGSSALERCYLRLASINLVLAANQRLSATALHAAGACVLLEMTPGWQDYLLDHLAGLLKTDQLMAMQQACSEITDGQGTRRVRQELLHV
jgi:UDP-2,4-diacetamido-2,4,6-trideoxy-beta-L-altropyranose hydrolase